MSFRLFVVFFQIFSTYNLLEITNGGLMSRCHVEDRSLSVGFGIYRWLLPNILFWWIFMYLLGTVDTVCSGIRTDMSSIGVSSRFFLLLQKSWGWRRENWKGMVFAKWFDFGARCCFCIVGPRHLERYRMPFLDVWVDLLNFVGGIIW